MEKRVYERGGHLPWVIQQANSRHGACSQLAWREGLEMNGWPASVSEQGEASVHVTVCAVTHACLPLLCINCCVPHHHVFKIRAFRQVRAKTGHRGLKKEISIPLTMLRIIIIPFY